MLKYNLSRAGFGVCMFSGASMALEEFHRMKPDLILSDWLMPGMDGLEFCRVLRQTPEMSKVPIIMMSCKGDETDVPAARRCGVADYFVKPFPIRDLVDRIRIVLENSAARLIQKAASADHDPQPFKIPGFREACDTGPQVYGSVRASNLESRKIGSAAV